MAISQECVNRDKGENAEHISPDVSNIVNQISPEKGRDQTKLEPNTRCRKETMMQIRASPPVHPIYLMWECGEGQ